MKGKMKRNNNQSTAIQFLLVLNLVLVVSAVLFVKCGIEPVLVDLFSKGDETGGL